MKMKTSTNFIVDEKVDQGIQINRRNLIAGSKKADQSFDKLSKFVNRTLYLITLTKRSENVVSN